MEDVGLERCLASRSFAWAETAHAAGKNVAKCMISTPIGVFDELFYC